MGRTELRRMPAIPLPPLKLRTAGLPRYGFKGGTDSRQRNYAGAYICHLKSALLLHFQFAKVGDAG